MAQGASDSSKLSVVWGPKKPNLYTGTLGNLLDEQAKKNGNRLATVFSWQSHRLNYQQMCDRSILLARCFLSLGLKHGDCIGIMAGNCYQYIEAFLGAARIGCPYVVLNNTYTERELGAALATSCCKVVFLPATIGVKDMSQHIKMLGDSKKSLPHLEHIVFLSDQAKAPGQNIKSHYYSTFATEKQCANISKSDFQKAEQGVKSDDIINLQFTSGTTGAPKAAMLTHINLVNNGMLVGAAQKLTEEDVICCPPPLFHCFGLVMGFLAAVTHGCAIVFPADQFEPNQVLDAVVNEKCTTMMGVPTMFIAELAANQSKGYKITTVKTGLAAGSPVPSSLMKQLERQFGITGMLIAYGMTETSPVTFITALDDSQEKRTKTVGRIMPHSGAKVVDKEGNIVSRGVRGELCTSGYALQKGYWKNEAKTAEAMKTDENGVRWMYTGDECIIDEQGYCSVTGRIKDMIIRGGENIFPLEIEENLLELDAIAEASVVGIKNSKYGEVVGAFLKLREGSQRPESAELVQWVRKSLGSHKSPAHIFWIGDSEVGEDFPKTGSGKHQKHVLRALGDRLVANSAPKGKL